MSFQDPNPCKLGKQSYTIKWEWLWHSSALRTDKILTQLGPHFIIHKMMAGLHVLRIHSKSTPAIQRNQKVVLLYENVVMMSMFARSIILKTASKKYLPHSHSQWQQESLVSEWTCNHQKYPGRALIMWNAVNRYRAAQSGERLLRLACVQFMNPVM